MKYERPSSLTATAAASSPQAPKCILVVEDEHLIRIMASDALRNSGYNVMEAASAEEALLWIVPFSPDLIVSNMWLSGCMDGLALLATLRKGYPTLPVIITSSHLNSSNAPTDDNAFFPPKPADVDELIKIVQNTIGPPLS